MKKISILLICSILISIIFSGCGNQEVDYVDMVGKVLDENNIKYTIKDADIKLVMLKSLETLPANEGEIAIGVFQTLNSRDAYEHALYDHKQLVKTANACGEKIETNEINEDYYKQYSYYVPATDTYETIAIKDDYYLQCSNIPSQSKDILDNLLEILQNIE